MTIVREDYPLVQTAQGTLRGMEVDGVLTFRGIRYATARRFGMPQAPESWEGIREAYVFGDACPSSGVSRSTLFTTNRSWPQSEDCLNLNVWTKDVTGKKPVMVWIHGGGFSGGSAISEVIMDGDSLAATGEAVVVSVNHRLNCLGFLDLRDFGPEFAASANAGLYDLIAALQWIRENIAAFGGDPENVTMFGQSGGGAKILALLQMPGADGLIHRAIIQSGVMKAQKSWREPLSREFGRKTAEALGLDETNMEAIREIPYEQLVQATKKAQTQFGGFMDFYGPHPDGVDLIDDELCGFRPETAHVPVMAGTCLGELAMFDPRGMKAAPFTKAELTNLTEQEKTARLAERFGEDAGAVVEEMKKAYPELDVLHALNVDAALRPTTMDYVKVRSVESRVYNYIFTYEIPVLEGKLPWHGADLPFCFANLHRSEVMRAGGEAAEKVMQTLRDIWLTFARTGEPGWQAYTEENRICMLLGAESRTAENHDEKLLNLIRSHVRSMFG